MNEMKQFNRIVNIVNPLTEICAINAQSGQLNKTAVIVILSMRSLVSIKQQSPRRPCDIFPKCFHWIQGIQRQKIFVITVKGFESAISCVRARDASTAPARHMGETWSLNWLQFILQWLIWLAEFIEFLFHLGKTPVGSPVDCPKTVSNLCVEFKTVLISLHREQIPYYIFQLQKSCFRVRRWNGGWNLIREWGAKNMMMVMIVALWMTSGGCCFGVRAWSWNNWFQNP